MLKRRNMLAALLGSAGLGLLSGCDEDESAGSNSETNLSSSEKNCSSPLFFTQQDQVVEFLPDQSGRQIGTVTGGITGISSVHFQFNLQFGASAFTFDNDVLLIDLNGNQFRFRNVGTGQVLTPLDPDLSFFGGPLAGTYECIDASDKNSNLIGRIFSYRAIASNPTPNILGTVYVEVFKD